MDKSHFIKTFKRGLGCAFLEILNSDCRAEYKDSVLWCCVHNTCYDMQSEGDRGEYLFEAIKLIDDVEFFETSIIKKYSRENSKQLWLFDQLSGLLYIFAVQGSETAKKALYSKYKILYDRISNMRIWQTDVVSAFEALCVWLTSLDGFPAFKNIVEHIGLLYLKHNDKYDLGLDWFYLNSRDKFGEKRVDNYLQKQAFKSKPAAAFYKKTERSIYVEKPVIATIQDYMGTCTGDTLEANEFICRRNARLFSRHATQQDLFILANKAIATHDVKLKLRLLQVFCFLPFPLDEKYIIELVDNEDGDIREKAYEIMEQITSPKIHDYIVEALQNKTDVSNAIPVLCKNYRKEDEILLLRSVKLVPVTYHGDGGWHHCFMAVDDLFRNRRIKVNKEILVYMYRRTLCSYCRFHLVETMHKQKALSEDILRECEYDSYADTRAFARRILNSQ